MRKYEEWIMQGNIDELKENYNGNKSYGFIYANETKYFSINQL